MKKDRSVAQSRRRTSRLSDFANRLVSEWRRLELPQAGEKIVVAVSGGADSTALLLALNELTDVGKVRLKLIVAHLDHGLRKGSQEDAEWVHRLCQSLNCEVVVASTNVKRKAKDTADNLEQAARRARYDFFRKTAETQGAPCVLTAHTLDDQAETILMRLIRGSAAEGLSGIEAVRRLETNSEIKLARPLLSWARRSDTEQYCRSRRLRFRVDEMNADERFFRVKVRRQLLPLMQSFNNKVVEALARTASLLREDAAALSDQALQLLQQASDGAPVQKGRTGNAVLNVTVLAGAPAAIRRRALRQWISLDQGHVRRVEMVHLLGIERLLEGQRGGVAELPNGLKVTRKGGWLYLAGRNG